MDAPLASLSSSLADDEHAILAALLRLAGELKPPVAAATLTSVDTEAAAVRSQLRAHDERISQLEEFAAVQDRPTDEAEVRAVVRRHRAKSTELAASLRELTIKARTARPGIEAAERAALFAMDAEGATRAGGADDPKAVGASARASAQAARDVTGSLRRTYQLVNAENERTEATLRSLEEQGRTLKGTLKEQRGIGGTLNSGKRKLSKLEKREFTDRVLIAAAFAFFLLVVVHITKRRLGLSFLTMQLLQSSPTPPPSSAMASGVTGGDLSDAPPVLEGLGDASHDGTVSADAVRFVVAAAANAAGAALGFAKTEASAPAGITAEVATAGLVDEPSCEQRDGDGADSSTCDVGASSASEPTCSQHADGGAEQPTCQQPLERVADAGGHLADAEAGAGGHSPYKPPEQMPAPASDGVAQDLE